MRLIDADDFIAKTRELYNQAGWGFRDIHYSQSDMEFNLSVMPTIDPVRHGRWVTMSDADGRYYACSECGESLARRQYYDPQFDLFPRLKSIDKTQFCPHCGAKMDEGGEKNETAD